MTWIQIIVAIVAILGILAFLLSVVGLLTMDRSYHPMSRSEEYEWLTKEHGLTHEEAEAVMDESWRKRLT